MANGLNSIVKRGGGGGGGESGKMGSRRIFTAHFKLQVLDSYRADSDCKGNQRATARKYGIHRRQIQKWLQAEKSLRTSVGCAAPGARSDGSGDAEAATLDCARQGGAHACAAISRERATHNNNNNNNANNNNNNEAAIASNAQQCRDSNNDRLCPMDLTVRRKCEESVEKFSDVLDLTCRKRSHRAASSSTSEVSSSTENSNAAAAAVVQQPPAKAIKLFKPYLLSDDRDKMATGDVSKAPAVVTTNVDPWHTNIGGAFYPLDCYTPPGYPYAYSYYTAAAAAPLEQQVRYSPCYDSASSYSPGSCYDEDCASLSPDSEHAASRQRHSYLDFNMAAVDSYYHRRQISKWHKQDLFTMKCRLETSPPLT